MHKVKLTIHNTTALVTLPRHDPPTLAPNELLMSACDYMYLGGKLPGPTYFERVIERADLHYPRGSIILTIQGD